MFDVASSELIVLGVVALLVIPPKDLPKAMRAAGYWLGKVRGVATQFRSGFDTMLREAELHEMEKKWAAENERIMREHPPTPAMMPMAAIADDRAADAARDGEDTPPVTVEPPMISNPLVFGEVEPDPQPAPQHALQPDAPTPKTGMPT